MTDGEPQVTESTAAPAKSIAYTAPAKLPPGSARTFSCPSCGGTVNIRALGTSITAVCQSCGTLIDVANENYRIIKVAAVKIAASQIPIGTRGTLFDTEWEVIGYSTRTDGSGMNGWREYLLFNPYQGFRFLTEADGHWNFVRMLRQSIAGDGESDNVWLGDREYRIFERGEAIVTYVMGEFYWRVKIHDTAVVADYVAPPYILSMEKSDGDIVWSQGVYMEPQEVAAAFGLSSLPEPQGIAPNQPAPSQAKNMGLWGIFGVFFILMVAVQILMPRFHPRQEIYHRTVEAPAMYKNQVLLADPIDIPDGIGNVEVFAQSPVNNNWVELEVSLANDTTKETQALTLPIEYYYGSDSDGSWTEGTQHSSAVMSAIHGGSYRFLIEPDAGAFNQQQPVNLDISVVRHTSMWGNFWIALMVLLLYPGIVTMRRWSFEAQRWSNSDYAPTNYADAKKTKASVFNWIGIILFTIFYIWISS